MNFSRTVRRAFACCHSDPKRDGHILPRAGEEVKHAFKVIRTQRLLFRSKPKGGICAGETCRSCTVCCCFGGINEVEMTFIRDGREMMATVTLAERPVQP